MKTETNSSSVWKFVQKQKALISIILFFLIMPFVSENFLTLTNMGTLIYQATTLLMMAIGITFVILVGDCELSVGAELAFAGIMAIKLQNIFPVWLSLVVVILCGMVIAAINAFIVVEQGANAFITTLGMMTALKGVNLIISGGVPLMGTDPVFHAYGIGKFLGITYPFWVCIAIFIACFALQRFTSFGRNCYAVGGNPMVAKFSGINVKATKWLAFLICGVTTAIAGFSFSAQINTGSSAFGDTYALLVNCGVVVGGNVFGGGYGGVPQSAIGIIFFCVFENALNMIGVNPYWQQTLRGILIVLIIGLDCYARKKKREDV